MRIRQFAISTRNIAEDIRRKFISSKFKDSLKEASRELLRENKRDIDSTLSFRTSSQSPGSDASNETEASEPSYTGTTALVAVKEKGSVWEKIGARLKEKPIIQGIMDAARQASKTETGKTLGRGAKKAKDKIGDTTEDIREFWETSQNP